MTETDLAYAAGFFDGEGCIYIRLNPNGGARLVLELGQKRRESLDRLAELFGGSVQRKTRRASSVGLDRPFHVYRWGIMNMQAVRALELMLPFLGEKKAQAIVALDERLSWGGRRGRKLGPEVRAVRQNAHNELRRLKRADP